jgi:AraC-like DNA-binding protein
VDRALKDVRSSGLTVAEAAARWGFADSSHLVRACKSLYGETPTGGRIRPAGGGAAADPG